METAIIILVVILIIFLLLMLAGNFFFSFALNTESLFSMQKIMPILLKKNGTNVQEYSGYTGSKEEKDWFSKIRKNVYINSKDGLKLHGYEIINENGNGNYIIACHGYSGSANDMARYAKWYYSMGYSLIIPDARAHGTSEGHVRGMGWLERLDIPIWINKILSEHEDAKIALFGISMGAATVMMTSGEELPKQVCAVIEDCGYSSAWDEFEKQLKNMFHLPSFPLMNVASIVTKIRGGYSLKEASAVNQHKKCKLPVLFIHGKDDQFVPFEMLDIVYDAATTAKEKLAVENAGHAMSSTKEPEIYWNTVKAFLNKHMNEIVTDNK